MNKEQIEQAANNYIECLLEDEIDYTLIDDEETTYETGRCDALSRFGKDIFTAGAEWRINSIWHTSTEMPSIGIDEYGSGKDCLVKPKYGIIEIGQVLFDEGIYAMSCNNTTYTMDEIEAWAYLDDLLPDRKEDAE